jgi:uncharacterized protein (TIGR02996 family)
MSDEDALLAAIAAHPDEDTPRLAYADWLDEHDRPVRAEFIRVQVEIARKQETLPRVLLNRHVDLFKRNQELIDNHREELLGPLAKLPDTVKVEFHRGFISELTVDFEQLLNLQPEQFLRRGPFPEITVTDVAWWLHQVEPFARELYWVSAIEMQSARRSEPITLDRFEVAEGFAFNGPFDRLRSLNLEGCRTGDIGAGAIAGTAYFDHFPGLIDLDLSNNEITDDGVEALVASPLWPRLRSLVLGGNPISDLGAETLANAAGTSRLEHLNLRFTDIGQPGHQALTAHFGGRVQLF